MHQNVQFRALINFLSLSLAGCHSEDEGYLSLQIKPPPPPVQENEHDTSQSIVILISISGLILGIILMISFIILGSLAVAVVRNNSCQPINLCDLFIKRNRRSRTIQFNHASISLSNPVPSSCQHREAPSSDCCGVSNPPLYPGDRPPSYFDVAGAQNARVDWKWPPPYTSKEDVNAPDDKS